jgi:molybdopterin molybdotransferase
MLNYQDAQQIIIEQAHSFGKELVSIDNALGRVLAEPVYADRDYPPFNRVAMDGYAFKIEDFDIGIREFVIAETIYAGQVAVKDISSGECYKIMTGAPLPLSANVVIRREDTEEKHGTVQIKAAELRTNQNIARQGEDVKLGEEVMPPATRIKPAVITALASLGKAEVMVEQLPEVAMFTTGDEVIPVHQPILSHQIRNSNAHLLKSLLQQWNIAPIQVAHIPDNKEDLSRVLQGALSSDIIIMCGGVSAGDADYVPMVLESLGVKKLFHKVAIKPGKPIWCGLMPNGGMVFALPGNPLSCHVTFKLFIETYLRYAFGLGSNINIQLPLSAPKKKKAPLDEFFPVRIVAEPLVAYPLLFNGSGDIIAALHADAFALHPADKMDLMQNELVRCFTF